MHVPLDVGGGHVGAAGASPLEQGYDPSSCEMLGTVVGKGGGLGGAWLSNEALVESAMNDLRNKAASLGANYVQHGDPQLGGGNSAAMTSNTSAVVTGTAYRCLRRTGEEDASIPRGGAGFRFGAKAEQARDVCTHAGFRYESRDHEASCSGTPVDLGLPGHVELVYCSDSVCQIDVVLVPPPAAFLEEYRSLRNKLEDKYGRPHAQNKDVDRCHADAPSCVVAGDASFTYEWTWGTHHGLKLLTRAVDGKASIVVSYMTPERAEAQKPGPAL
jgi:hypothetical protein